MKFSRLQPTVLLPSPTCGRGEGGEGAYRKMRFLQRFSLSLSLTLPMNLNRTVGLEERPLCLDAGCRAERLRFRRMIFAGLNGILNDGGTPRKGASALHAEAIANTATVFRFMNSIRAKKIATAVSPTRGESEARGAKPDC